MSTSGGRARATAGARPARTAGLIAAAMTGLVTLAVLVGPVVPARADSTDTLLALLNDARADAGLAPLRAHGDLAATARSWSERMAGAGEISHNPALADQVPGGWRALGENVGMNQPADAAGLHRAWMDSPGHRANILGEQYTHVGIGLVVDDDGAAWATQVFATYPGGAGPAEQAEPAPAPEPDEPEQRDEPAQPRQERERAADDETDPGSGPPDAEQREAESTPSPTPRPTVTPSPTPTTTAPPSRAPKPSPSPTDAADTPRAQDDDGTPLPPAALVALGVGALAGVVVPLALRRARMRTGREETGRDGPPIGS